MLSHDPRARQIEVSHRLATEAPGIRAREDQLVQVLLNLGINALDAIEGRGQLVFSSSLEKGEAVIRVADTGAGIPPAARDRIFEPFFTTKPAGKGTGLGLFVTRAIVEELKGRLAVEESDARGSVFVVRLSTAAPLPGNAAQ